MNPSDIQNLARQSAQQGQQAYQSDIAQQNQYQQQANTAQQQAQAAQDAMKQQTQYMQGAGSGANLYSGELSRLQQQYAPSLPQSLAGANQSLNQLTGAFNAAQQQFAQPGGMGGGFGLSAGQMAGYEQGVLQPLQTGVSTASTMVGNLNQQLATLSDAASKYTSGEVATEQNVVSNLQNTYNAAYQTAQQALGEMNSFATLAQQQGTLNAQQTEAYNSALNSYYSAQQALAQANQINQQIQYAKDVVAKYGIAASNPQLYSTLQSTTTPTSSKTVNLTPNKTPSKGPEIITNPSAQLNQWGSDIMQAPYALGKIPGGILQGIGRLFK